MKWPQLTNDALISIGAGAFAEWRLEFLYSGKFTLAGILSTIGLCLLLIFLGRQFGGLGFERPLWKLRKGLSDG